jgi:membrane-associated phospholipid phosphatase
MNFSTKIDRRAAGAPSGDVTPAGPSRRGLLKALGALSVIGAVPLEAAAASGTLDVAHRPAKAFRKKMHAAAQDRRVHVPRHTDNGDEAQFPNGIANYTKGFPHDQFGEVDPDVYASYREAVRSGRRADFDALRMGGDTPLVDPQAGLAFDLEGIDVSQHAIPPFDSLTSPGLAAQAVEVYWQALARDVPFSRYGAEPTTQAAAAELSGLAAFGGPRANGSVSAGTLFRGFTAGDQLGPYVSQFFMQPFTYGVIPFAGCMTTLPGDFMTDTGSWLRVQNGQRPFQSARPDPQIRYLRNGRDLAEYVHNDVLFQEYLNAALMLATMHAPLNSRNPYDNLRSETGFITFGLPMVHVLVAEVIARALKHTWFQKWFVHRMARPEETGGLVHFTLTGQKQYPLDASLLQSQAVHQVFSRTGAYLLPHSYPEGCPQHPSYPSGHATAAGAAVTVLKWFFDESFVLPKPLVATDDGTALVPYTGADAGRLTVGGELEKLASNVGLGRVFAGIHWRQDIAEGMRLGEAVAIALLKDQAHLYGEDFHGFTFTKFDGTQVTV